MKFCDVCDNILYMMLDPQKENRLLFACKNCGNLTEASSGDDCIVDANYVDDRVNLHQYATPNIVHDPTLPVVDNIRCPNAACTKPPDAGNRVIFVKIDPVGMKYMYHCCHCSHFWHLK